MDQLEIGDRVLTVTGDMQPEFREVFFFGHKSAVETAAFNCLHTASGKKMCLTEDHFLMAGNSADWASAAYTRSRHVAAGMTVWQTSATGALEATTVLKVTEEFKQGLFNPFTSANAMIVVNGVVASTQSAWFLDDIVPQSLDWAVPHVYEAALKVGRLIYHHVGPQWAQGIQERSDVTSVREATGAFAVVAPYFNLVANEAPAFVAGLWANAKSAF